MSEIVKCGTCQEPRFGRGQGAHVDPAQDARCQETMPPSPTYDHGSSATYPSQAASYGSGMLMAMAGTLAEQAEATLREHSHLVQDDPETMALTGTVYALLALTQAVRDLPEQIAATLPAALAEAIEAAGV